MAAIHDLIAQVQDKVLRQRLDEELVRLTKGRKFGLLFEGHLPELTPMYSAKIARGALVAHRDAALTDMWRVLSVTKGHAQCIHRESGRKEEMDVSDLVMVRQFGEPIFPSLVPMDRVANGPVDVPWHTLIEADNYHALQLLEYLYAGQVDCIYIDPPYNTGARDWKYNNDYVDGNDSWRHSKWLAFMQKRLKLCKRLLKPDIGVLIVTIDEHEVHHLGMLLEQVFPNIYRQMVTIVNTPGGVTQGRFSRVEEHAFYCFNDDAYIAPSPDDLLSSENSKKTSSLAGWQSLIRRGVGSRREDRPGMFFPVNIDPIKQKILSAGPPLPIKEKPDLLLAENREIAWPIRSDGELGRWRIGPTTFSKLLALGFVKLGGYDAKRRTWTVLYLQQKAIAEIEAGTLEIIDRDEVTGAVVLGLGAGATQLTPIKTVWNRSAHHAGSHGSTLLRNIFGQTCSFSFPKSLYATRDAVAAVVRDRPQALIVDFFAGSGTTLNAVNLLNATDGGRRRCIMITNNEVSEQEAKKLTGKGLRPGQPEWEQHGICQSVNWPRTKYTIRGRRDNGSMLEGDYFTGKTTEKEIDRRFVHIGFVDPATLTTAAKKKQVVSLIDGLPQSAVKRDEQFIVLPNYSASILFDDAAAEHWLAALEEQDHITDFYIVTPRQAVFTDLKAKIVDLLGPLLVTEEEKRPMGEGFPENIEYFRLDFLDKDQVALKRRFIEILPILWLRSGALGPRPELLKSSVDPDWLVPEQNAFAVLLNEHRFGAFLESISGRPDLTHVFLVTDSEDAFHEMAMQIKAPAVIQLYRDYLENFMINQGDVL